MKKHNILKWCLIVAGLWLMMFWLVSVGVKKTERIECEQWRAQRQQYPSFYLSGWQVEQCTRYGMEK